MAFESEPQLRDWLHGHGIDTSAWGTGEYKSLGDLWAEYRNGETVFTDDPPCRNTSVVKVFIRDGDRLLFEVEQVLAGGERRPRDSVPAEKMKPGETVRQAALRCVREELGIAIDDDASGCGESPVSVQVRISPSYPGLKTRYTYFECEVDVPGLPEGRFTTGEAGDAVSEHVWQWRPEKAVRGTRDHR